MTIAITSTCPFCGKEQYILVNENDLVAWHNGELIQNAFPYLSANEREALKTGICSECWDKMFSFPDEEEEEEEPEEFDYDFADYNIEVGFNPYTGSYDWDC